MLFWQFDSIVGNPTPGLKLTPAPLWLKLIFIGISMVEHNLLVNSGNSLYMLFWHVGNFEVFMLFNSGSLRGLAHHHSR